MWSVQELIPHVKEFNVSTVEETMVFEDWLEEQGQTEWAFISRYLREDGPPHNFNVFRLIENEDWAAYWSRVNIYHWVKYNELVAIK